jgi:2,3-bisphosphoglycerate-independent phosphoglycerate mutase
MDRDNNWDREKKAFDLFVGGKGDQYSSAKEAVEKNYSLGKSDENFEPSVIDGGALIKDGDSIIFFNHRSDRSRQMLSLFSGGRSAKVPANLSITTMTEYEKGQKAEIILLPENLKNTLSDVIADAGLKQYHTAETEKYAHVTYFLKAGNEELLKKETDKVVASKKVSYDKIPEMSAFEVTTAVEKAINEDYDFIVVNYANGDMVGHTGVMGAAVEACESVDKCLGEIMSLASQKGYKAFITADHGNCEVMVDELTRQPNKEHTTNPVPFVFLDFAKKPFAPVDTDFSVDDYIQYASGTPVGILADIAPSIIINLDLKRPKEMTGMDLSIAMI